MDCANESAISANIFRCFIKRSSTTLIFSYDIFVGVIWHGRNLVGERGDMCPPPFQTGSHNTPSPSTFLSLGFAFGEV